MSNLKKVVTIALTTAALLALAPDTTSATSDWEMCSALVQGPLEPASEQSRRLQLSALGIEISIPENYRSFAFRPDYVYVLTPAGYDYVQCLLENEVGTSIDVIGVEIRQTEPTSLAQLRRQAGVGGRFGVRRVLGETVVDGQPAFLYVSTGMHTNLVAQINMPDQDASIVVSTYIASEDNIPMEAEFLSVLSSINFL